MAIKEIDLDLSRVGPPSSPVADLLNEANRRIDEFFATERNKRHPKFIPSDAVLLYKAMAHVTEEKLTFGEIYCEWGSGFGVGPCMASLLGYRAIGIEIEKELVDISRSLADDLGIEVTFVEGSYLPEGFDSYQGFGGEELVTEAGWITAETTLQGNVRYPGTDFDIDEVDLFFVYPWPGEQEFMLDMFDAIAAEGAVILVYFGDREIRAFRRSYR
jgi:hypothetical protein